MCIVQSAMSTPPSVVANQDHDDVGDVNNETATLDNTDRAKYCNMRIDESMINILMNYPSPHVTLEKTSRFQNL